MYYRVHQLNFFGNIKNRQPAYASLGSLEDKIFFFFCPKNQVQLAPQSLVLLENSRELISNFFKFSIFEKGSGTYREHQKNLKFVFENFFLFFFKSLKRVKNRKSKMSQLFTKMNFLENKLLQIILSLLADIIPPDIQFKVFC